MSFLACYAYDSSPAHDLAWEQSQTSRYSFNVNGILCPVISNHITTVSAALHIGKHRVSATQWADKLEAWHASRNPLRARDRPNDIEHLGLTNLTPHAVGNTRPDIKFTCRASSAPDPLLL